MINLHFKSFSQKVISLRVIIALMTFITVHSSPYFELSKWELYYSATLADSLDPPNNLNNLDLLKLGIPSFKQDAPTNISIKPSGVNLILLSETPNEITDDEAWFEDNNLTLPTYQVPNPFQQILGNIPNRVLKNFQDNILVQGIRYPQEEFFVYGENFSDSKYLLVYDLEKHQFTSGYDFSNYAISPTYIKSDRPYINQSLNWIVPEDNILYFSHSHNTYAQSSHGMNAYLTALDRDSNRVIWRSQPLVCNARNFVIIDNVIVCGYGFTAEPDYLYLIDKHTGNILQQIQLKTAPEYIIPKDNKLYVRTYDTNYVFDIQRQ
ncbi:MAG: hypothetical protein ACFCU5_17935 [Pleurocapsa sp.]